MLKKISIITFVALLIGLTAWLVQPGTVGQAQVYYQTPTANAEGRILYGVKAGDTCLSVSIQAALGLFSLIQPLIGSLQTVE